MSQSRPTTPGRVWGFVVDASSVLYLASARIEVSAKHKLLARINRMSIRLLADAVFRRRAWEVANRLGWATTYDAEYIDSLNCTAAPS